MKKPTLGGLAFYNTFYSEDTTLLQVCPITKIPPSTHYFNSAEEIHLDGFSNQSLQPTWCSYRGGCNV